MLTSCYRRKFIKVYTINKNIPKSHDFEKIIYNYPTNDVKRIEPRYHPKNKLNLNYSVNLSYPSTNRE